MKKTNLLFFLCLLSCTPALAQEEHENEIEQLTATDEQQIRNPEETNGLFLDTKLNINSVSEEELLALHFLTIDQIRNFFIHRNKYGKFISLFELQAIPQWDIHTIKQVVPYLYLSTEQEKINVKHSITKGKHLLLYRTGGKPNGYGNKDSWLKRNRQLLNYKFKYKDQYQTGIIIEKDAGEPELMDHISMYLHVKNKGIIKDLLIGDYTINMGQGLVHWQGYAFGRSSNILSGYRQANFIQPHTGTDENRFHRGIAMRLKKGNIEFGLFGSRLNIDANVMMDSIKDTRWISSFLLSGIHRTDEERKDKDAVTKLTWGSKLRFNFLHGALSLNFVQTNFSIPIQKRAQPYNQFAIAGKEWKNMSIDGFTTTKVGFFFGELALDHQYDYAFNMGWLKSLDSKLDISMIYRKMSRGYKALESNCISSNSEAGNETGILVSFNFQPQAKHWIEGFADYAQQHWPSFTSDFPSQSKLISLQYSWKPNKKTEILTRYQIDKRTNNQGYEHNHTNWVGERTIHRWRTHIAFSPLESLTIRCRNEWVIVNEEFRTKSTGNLTYIELIVKPVSEPLSLSFRHTFFSTDDYASRIYAYERDLTSFYAIPAHYNQGNRNYLLAQYNYKKAIKIQLKIMGDQRREKNYISSIFQSPLKNKEWRMQVIWEIGG